MHNHTYDKFFSNEEAINNHDISPLGLANLFQKRFYAK